MYYITVPIKIEKACTGACCTHIHSCIEWKKYSTSEGRPYLFANYEGAYNFGMRWLYEKNNFQIVKGSL